MNAWAVVLLAGAASYALRAVPLFAAARVAERPAARRVLELVLPAVLAAMTVGAVTHHDGAGRPGDRVGVALALACGAILAARKRPMLVIVTVGVGAYWLVAAGTGILSGAAAG